MGGRKKFSWWGSRLCDGGSGPRVEHNSTPFNSLQLSAAGEPADYATRSLSLKASLLTGASSSLLDDACMDDVPRETVDMQPA